jgi:hypothetical protein
LNRALATRAGSSLKRRGGVSGKKSLMC